MNKKILYSLILAAAIAALVSCSSDTAPAAKSAAPAAEVKPAGPPEPVAAQSAFFEMYKPARTWATDLLPLTLVCGDIPGVKNADGKCGKWTVVFVSPSKREARTFDYAVADAGTDVRKGVNMGGAQPWSGATPKSRPFQVTEFQTNSDAAYKAAAEKAADWLKKNPDKKLTTLSLANASKYASPLWYVMWGDSKSGFLAHINATTGTAVSIK